MERFTTKSILSTTINIPILADRLNQLYSKMSEGTDLSIRDFTRQIISIGAFPEKNREHADQILSDQIQTLVEENASLREEIHSGSTNTPAAHETLDNYQRMLSQQTAEIEALTQEIEQKKIHASQLNDIQNQMHGQILALQQENDLLKEQISQGLKLSDRQFIVTMDPFTAHVMDTTCKGESERLGKEITPDILLLQMFLSYYIHGEHEHFPFYFSRRELRELAEYYKQAENQDTPQQ
ncbi:MAG TPA: hypothetical protein PLE85_11210 [Bacteroidales bacterium]|nr:hypothetical protein [Bacteroidales bacterium]